MTVSIYKSPATAATKLRAGAAALQAKIDHGRRPMTQNLTPKRNREYQQRMHDATNLEATQRAMLALADAHDAGTVPAELAKLTRTSQIAPLVRKGIVSHGYYDVSTAPDFSDKSRAAKLLQSMIGSGPAHVDLGFLERAARLAKIPGFFPTPPAIAKRMAEMARIKPGDIVLEPSAGSGRLIDAALKAEPTAVVHAVEYSHHLAELLEKKQATSKFTLHRGDFLTEQLDVMADVILMNPPFEKSADAYHVIHAFETYLKPGGRLVAIVSSGTLTRSIGPATELQDLLKKAVLVEPIEAGSFEDTGVSAAIIMLRRDE